MDRFNELPPKRRKPEQDELDDYKKQRDLELEETEELSEVKRTRSPIGYIVGD